jgi:hypothetical protein
VKEALRYWERRISDRPVQQTELQKISVFTEEIAEEAKLQRSAAITLLLVMAPMF